jgi:hypothetical protein
VTAVKGDGSSFETAFVVYTTTAEVHGAEERWILAWESEHGGTPAIEPKGNLRRSTAWAKGKSYDIVTLTRPDGSLRTFYFDTSRLRLESPRARGQ